MIHSLHLLYMHKTNDTLISYRCEPVHSRIISIVCWVIKVNKLPAWLIKILDVEYFQYTKHKISKNNYRHIIET